MVAEVLPCARARSREEKKIVVWEDDVPTNAADEGMKGRSQK